MDWPTALLAIGALLLWAALAWSARTHGADKDMD